MTPVMVRPGWDHRTFSTRLVTTMPTMRFHHTAPGRTAHHAMQDIWPAFKKVGQSQAVYEEAVLRSLVSDRNKQV